MGIEFSNNLNEISSADKEEIKSNLKSEIESACHYYQIKASNLLVSLSKDESPIALEFDVSESGKSVIHVRYTLFGARTTFYKKA